MKSKEKEYIKFSSRHVYSVIGIFIVLISILFLLAPTTHLQPLCYVFEFPFGLFGAYFIYGALIYLGIRITFREHFYRFSIRAFIGLIIFFVGFIILGSATRYELLLELNRSFAVEFKEFAYEGLNGGLFGDVSLGGGELGYLIVKSLYDVGSYLPLLIGSLILVLGLVVIALPGIIKFIKWSRSKRAISRSKRERIAMERRNREENIIFTDYEDKPIQDETNYIERESNEPVYEKVSEEEIDVPKKEFVSNAPVINFNAEAIVEDEPAAVNFSFKSAKDLDIPSRKELRENEQKITTPYREVAPNAVEIPNAHIPYTSDTGEEGLHLAFFDPNPQQIKPVEKPSLISPVIMPIEEKEKVEDRGIDFDNVIEVESSDPEPKDNSYLFSASEEEVEGSYLDSEPEVESQAELQEEEEEEVTIDFNPSIENSINLAEEFEKIEEEDPLPPIQEYKPQQQGDSILFREPVSQPKPAQNVQPESKISANPGNVGIDPVSGMPFAKPRKKYIMPTLDLLDQGNSSQDIEAQKAECEEKSNIINQAFEDFGINSRVTSYTIGPSVTRYNISTDRQSSVTQINKVLTDLSVRLYGIPVRFSEIVPGMTTSGLEIANKETRIVTIREVLTKFYNDKNSTLIPFGMNISGEIVYSDLKKFPHLLVAGTTGSGKSIFMHGLLLTLIMRNRPEDLKLLLIDPKKVEMARYKAIPHLLCPIVKDAGEAKIALSKLIDEMERRFEVFDKCGYSSIKEYNEYYAPEAKTEKMPYIVCVIDEFADLVEQNRDVSSDLLRLASKARSAGIHLIVATQRPDVKVISGTIKANLGVRVALSVSSTVDSQTIIGKAGAEELCGNGDMLVDCAVISKQLIRAQGCFVNRPESNRVTDFIAKQMEQNFDPNFLDLTDYSNEGPMETDYEASGPSRAELKASSDEAMYREICLVTIKEDFMSISKIQRFFPIGFNRAGKFFSKLQEDGIIDKNTDSLFSNKGHKVLIHSEEELFKEEEMSSIKPTF